MARPESARPDTTRPDATRFDPAPALTLVAVDGIRLPRDPAQASFVRAIDRDDRAAVDPLGVAGVAAAPEGLLGWRDAVAAYPFAAACLTAAAEEPSAVWAALTQEARLRFTAIDGGPPFVRREDHRRFAVLRMIAEGGLLPPERLRLRPAVIEHHRLDPRVDILAREIEAAAAALGDAWTVAVEGVARPGRPDASRRWFDPVFVATLPDGASRRLDRPGALRLLARLRRRLASGRPPCPDPSIFEPPAAMPQPVSVPDGERP